MLKMPPRRPLSSKSLKICWLQSPLLHFVSLTALFPSNVAIHILGGDGITTWTHPKSKAFWLKDFLPQQISDARIMTFGYNAASASRQSTAEIVDHAKSLLASLVDKRGEPEVHSAAKDGVKMRLMCVRIFTVLSYFSPTPRGKLW